MPTARPLPKKFLTCLEEMQDQLRLIAQRARLALTEMETSPGPYRQVHVLLRDDVIPPGVLADLGILTAVPVVNVYQPADQRKWCLAVQQWLEAGYMRRQDCLTNDLLNGGICRRSPSSGRCLLLLPFTHPDWQPALGERYDPELGAFVWRDEPVPPPLRRQPLTPEEVER